VAHVGVEGFGPGHGQHDRAESDEGGQTVRGGETDGVQREHGKEHIRLAGDLHEAEQGYSEKPEGTDRTEQHAHCAGAAILNKEQRDNDCRRNWQHELVQSG
jgi:hypothetical protein